MSIPRGFSTSGAKLYSNITMPAMVNLNFVVDSTNGNGLGIRSLKSNGYVRNVFMATSATPGSNDGYLNPNPAAGYALVQFKNNFNKYLGGFSGFVSPTTGSALTSVTARAPYIIGSLGTTTLAQWQAKGLPLGIVPAPGVSFVATATGAIGGTGTVFAPGVSGIGSVEVIGDANLSISNPSVAQYGGAWLMIQFLAPTSSSVTTPIATAPANGSVVSLSSVFDLSSVTIDGL